MSDVDPELFCCPLAHRDLLSLLGSLSHHDRAGEVRAHPAYPVPTLFLGRWPAVFVRLYVPSSVRQIEEEQQESSSKHPHPLPLHSTPKDGVSDAITERLPRVFPRVHVLAGVYEGFSGGCLRAFLNNLLQAFSLLLAPLLRVPLLLVLLCAMFKRTY